MKELREGTQNRLINGKLLIFLNKAEDLVLSRLAFQTKA